MCVAAGLRHTKHTRKTFESKCDTLAIDLVELGKSSERAMVAVLTTRKGDTIQAIDMAGRKGKDAMKNALRQTIVDAECCYKYQEISRVHTNMESGVKALTP